MSEAQEGQDFKKGQTSLRNYVENNHKLLTAMGVLFALTVFSTNLEPKSLALWLSFFLVACSALLWIEILSAMKGHSSLIQYFFQYSLIFAFLAFSLYWYIHYRSIWHNLLFLPIFYALLSGFFAFENKRKWFERILPNSRQIIQLPIRIAVAMVIVVVLLSITKLIVSPLRIFLDAIADSVEKPEVSRQSNPTSILRDELKIDVRRIERNNTYVQFCRKLPLP
ncbi:MAG: hypothetical protein L0Y74_10260 [candidate division Zixibacteria bacterium]|nr:hypothetical protein [candidate division Zixibacteria bacterium]